MKVVLNKWNALYSRLITEMESCRKTEVCEIKQVECAFVIAFNTWSEVKNQLLENVFESKEEEIQFYKKIKPGFTSHIDYLMLVNNALAFIPHESGEAEKEYWEREAERLERYIEKHSAFVDYYKSGRTDYDVQYFLPENYDLAETIVSKIYENDGEYMTSHDHIVCGLMAHQMYHAYVNKKLEKFK